MKKQEILSILITLAVGFFAGGFLYLNVFTSMVQPDNLETLEEIENFSITSQAYGGCRSNCPAFRVNGDGSYRYQYVPSIGAEPVLRSGNLPRSIRKDLEKTVVSRALATQTTRVVRNDCVSAVDGIDIVYDVVIDGTTYQLDSCRTNINPNSPTWQALSSVWTYFTEISQ